MEKEYKTNKESYNNDKSIEVYDAEKDKSTEIYLYKNIFLKPGKILDLGCGTGRTSIRLKELGLDVVAVDYSEAMIKRAKEKYGNIIDFEVMDASSLKYEDNSFDYVFFSFNGIDYLYPEEKRKQCYEEIFRVLKPGGFFAFSSHNALFIPDGLYRVYVFLKSAMYGKIYPYRLEFHPFGKLITRYISPKKQIRDLKNHGFTFIEIVSKYGQDIDKIKWKDPYPMYIFKKINNDKQAS